ncbi:MAG TPA: molybdate ABC transporter substrate-binding protein [Stellaceae bacterium]|nr:molybdate ABC transporter substrate-binding protein [Stellaceae bacterium]
MFPYKKRAGKSAVRSSRGASLGQLALLLILGTASAAHAAYPVAPDVVVFCEPTLQRAISDVGALFHTQTGIHVRVFVSPIRLLLEQVAHRARDDVLIGEGNVAAAAATEQRLIKQASLQQIGWHNQLVVAASNGETDAAGAGSTSGAAELASVAGKQTIAIVDPWAATAGADSKKAMQSLGLWQAVSSKSVGVVGTDDALFLLLHGKVPLAVVYATDVAANPGLTVAERLPPASYPPIEYWVAETARALSPNAGKFLDFLHTANAQKQLRADGLEISR